MPDTDVLLMLDQVITRGQVRMAEVLASGPSTGVGGKARTAVADLFKVWTALRANLVKLAAAREEVAGDLRLVDDERRRQTLVAQTALDDAATAGGADLEARFDALVAMLQAAALPTRPQPQDVAQEAALAALKSDCKMVLDPLDRFDIGAKMVELLGRFDAADDALGVWLIAGSTWPSMYLESRGADESSIRALPVQIGAALGPVDETVALARKLLTAATAPQGLYGSVMSMRQEAGMIARQLLKVPA